MFNIVSIILFGFHCYSSYLFLDISNTLVYLFLFLYIFQRAIFLLNRGFYLVGGDKGSRTLDLLLARQAL